jgi:hypothetical protein
VTVIVVVNEAMRKYSFAPVSEPKIISTTEVQDAIRGFKVGKAPGQNDMPNRPSKYLSLRIVFHFVV